MPVASHWLRQASVCAVLLLQSIGSASAANKACPCINSFADFPSAQSKLVNGKLEVSLSGKTYKYAGNYGLATCGVQRQCDGAVLLCQQPACVVR